MNFTFLLAGFGFVAIAGVLYYFTSKSEEFEEAPRKQTKEAPKPVVPVHEVIFGLWKFLILKNLNCYLKESDSFNLKFY